MLPGKKYAKLTKRQLRGTVQIQLRTVMPQKQYAASHMRNILVF